MYKSLSATLVCIGANAQPFETVNASGDDILDDTSDISVREFPVDLRTKYSNAEFVYEAKSKSKNFLDRLLESFSQWLEEFFDINTAETSMNVAVYIVKILAVLIVVVVIYFIVRAVLNKEGSWIFGRSASTKINYESLENNIHVADFEKLIRVSISAGEKRLGIRYYYLWLLKKMSDRNIIVWDPDKTNSDYIAELGSSRHRENFEYLSYLYNNIWYGEFDIDDQTFERAKNAFEDTLKTI